MGAASGYKGSRKFWEYNPQTDSWTAKRDFKGNISYNTYGFAYQGKGYVGERKKTSGGNMIRERINGRKKEPIREDIMDFRMRRRPIFWRIKTSMSWSR